MAGRGREATKPPGGNHREETTEKKPPGGNLAKRFRAWEAGEGDDGRAVTLEDRLTHACACRNDRRTGRPEKKPESLEGN